jgi:hypothetical protein
MTHALAGRRRRNVRDEGVVLEIVRDNPPTSTRHTPSATGRLSHRATKRTVLENKLYLVHEQPVQGLQQGTKISVYYSFLDECYASFSNVKSKPVRLLAMQAVRGRGNIPPTHS